MFKKPERPTKFNIGMGIGKALELGGNYYNDLAVEMRNQEALEEARAYQTSERVASQTHTEEMQDRRNEFTIEREELRREQEVSDLADANTREDIQREQDRGYALEDQQSQMDHDIAMQELQDSRVERTETVRFDQLSSEDQLSFANEIGMSTEGMMKLSEDSTPVIVGYDSKGEVVNVMGRDSQYKQTVNGWELTSRVSNSQGAKESEAAMDVRLSAFDAGLNEMVALFGEGYQTRGGGAAWNNIADNVWGGNWLVSGDAQQFKAARLQATEAIFKAFSGAAGSDAEAQRYASMLPSYGDTDATIQMKLRMMSRVRVAMERVTGIPPESFDPQWVPNQQEQALRDQSSEQGVRLSDVDLQRRGQLLAEMSSISRQFNFDPVSGFFIDPVTGEADVNLSPGAAKYVNGTVIPPGSNTGNIGAIDRRRPTYDYTGGIN